MGLEPFVEDANDRLCTVNTIKVRSVFVVARERASGRATAALCMLPGWKRVSSRRARDCPPPLPPPTPPLSTGAGRR